VNTPPGLRPGAHREPPGRVRAVRPADTGARPGDRVGCRDVLRSSRLRFRGKAQRQATAGRCKADDPADSPAHKATRRPAEIRGSPVREATPGSGTRARPRLRRGALRTDQRPCRTVGGCTCGTDPWIQAKKGLAGRIPAAVRTRQPCAGDPRWARRVANAVLILRVLMLQCRRVTGESLERPGSFLA
jgi:hypothetical protein